MKKVLVIFLILGLLALDYASLDDITTNKQPDYTLEYLFLFFSLIVFAVLGYFFISSWKRAK